MRRLALILALASLATAVRAQAPERWAREDPSKIRTAEACGECHVSAYEVWKRTPHATGFKTLHRLENAEAIAGRMGFKLIKRGSVCLTCHYTPTVQGERLRAVSGVSCESCHGAGADWIDVHNDYGGKGLDHLSEAPEHRTDRIARSIAAGMRRPSDLYALASACYGCHSVPDERLVNVGRHSIGSAGFELVEWSGNIRHNFLDSFLNGDGTDNAERGAPRKRLMYVAGRALELEHGLRGAAAATEKGVFLKAIQRRIRGALSEVRAINSLAGAPELDDIVATVRGVDVRLGNGPALLAAAERVGDAARRFLGGRDGSRLASLDPLVEGTAEIEIADDSGEDDGAAVAEAPAGASADAAAGSGATASAPGTTATSSTSGSAQASATSTAVPAEGAFKRRIRRASAHDTLDATTCQKCHGDQNAWWFDDAHYASVDPFFERAAKNVQIARLYGLSPSKMTRGDALCMDCHGTVVTGREKREVADGVSCQSCHGAAADFLEPHQEGDKALGASRPGYVKALQLGMTELKDDAIRAAACAGCHYVTDPRLISSGHPSGTDFDYASGMAEIRHWQSSSGAAGALATAYSSELAARGAVPKVRLARLAGVPAGASSPDAGGQAAGSTVSAATGAGSTGRASRSRRPRTPRARPLSSTATAETADAEGLGLPPFPEIDASTPVEEILLLLKERLELLYDAVRGEAP